MIGNRHVEWIYCPLYFREQRTMQPYLHGYLATAARVKGTAPCSGDFDFV